VDEYNSRQEEVTERTSSRFQAIQTPAAKASDTNQKRATMFNDELERLENKLATMNDVNYERPKIDFLYGLAEKAIEEQPHLDLIVERLSVLEQIHKQGPNIIAQLDNINQNVLFRFPQCLKAEREQIEAVKQQVIGSVPAIEELFK
jgi:hypothetical protein